MDTPESNNADELRNTTEGTSGFRTPAKQSTSQQKLTVEQLTKLRRKKFKEKIASTEAQLVKQLISPYVDDLEETKRNSHQALDEIKESLTRSLPQKVLIAHSSANRLKSSHTIRMQQQTMRDKEAKKALRAFQRNS